MIYCYAKVHVTISVPKLSFILQKLSCLVGSHIAKAVMSCGIPYCKSCHVLWDPILQKLSCLVGSHIAKAVMSCGIQVCSQSRLLSLPLKINYKVFCVLSAGMPTSWWAFKDFVQFVHVIQTLKLVLL